MAALVSRLAIEWQVEMAFVFFGVSNPLQRRVFEFGLFGLGYGVVLALALA